MKYKFIEAHREAYAVKIMCRVLEVSRSGYYDWRKRKPSARDRANAKRLEEIKKIFERSRKTYGSPRIRTEGAGQNMQPQPGSAANAQARHPRPAAPATCQDDRQQA